MKYLLSLTFFVYIWAVAYLLTFLPSDLNSYWYSFPLFMTITSGGVYTLIVSIDHLVDTLGNPFNK